MIIFNAFVSGFCCGAAIHCFTGGDVVLGIGNLVLCLINGVSAVYKK